MSLLLDTHVAIWAVSDPARIPRQIQSLIETEADRVFVSHISLWEIAIKYQLGRHSAPPMSASATIADLLGAGFVLLPLGLEHVLAFERVPTLHSDPYDRLLVAQALLEGLSLVTHDSRLAAYSDTVIAW